ncbi:MAG: CheR family methyltransferase, partial [Mariprofundaceae bacterium]
MQEEQFNFIRGFLMERSGLAIDRQKTYLLKSRLQPMIRQHALLGLDELVDRIKAGDRRLSQLLVEAMVTSETLFFRDGYPFDALCDLFLPGISATGHVIRIWSAAAASGQEPYSIAMSIAEKAPDIIPRLEIVATDISRTALKKAMSGQYTH